MSDLSREFIAAVSSLEGSDFNQHYNAGDPCGVGSKAHRRYSLTDPLCMERGLGQNNSYDCMGLPIAAICRVLGIDPQSQWPVEFRHMEQLSVLGEKRAGVPGDTIVFYSRVWHSLEHMGVLCDEKGRFLHAKGVDAALSFVTGETSGVVSAKLSSRSAVRYIGVEDLAAIPQTDPSA